MGDSLPGVAGHVFISYSRSDLDYVERLAGHLSAAGVAVWFDHELAAGEPFAAVIQQRIDSCAALVVVRTPASAASAWVDREISYAQHIGKPVLPLLLQPSRMPILLVALHQEDVTTGVLPSQRFMATFAALTGGDAEPPVDPAPRAAVGPPVGPAHLAATARRSEEFAAAARQQRSTMAAYVEWARRQNRPRAVALAMGEVVVLATAWALSVATSDIAGIVTDASIRTTWIAGAGLVFVAFITEVGLALEVAGRFHPRYSMFGSRLIALAAFGRRFEGSASGAAVVLIGACMAGVLVVLGPLATTLATTLGLVGSALLRLRAWRSDAANPQPAVPDDL